MRFGSDIFFMLADQYVSLEFDKKTLQFAIKKLAPATISLKFTISAKI